MSLRELVEADCGGANQLMRLGSQLVRDAAYKDQGLSKLPPGVSIPTTSLPGSSDQLVNEFLGQMAAVPPQTFRMDALLQEMREIDAHNFQSHVVRAPPVIDEVNNGAVWANKFAELEKINDSGAQLPSNANLIWNQSQQNDARTRDFFNGPPPNASQIWNQRQQLQSFHQNNSYTRDFFSAPPSSQVWNQRQQFQNFQQNQNRDSEFFEVAEKSVDGNEIQRAAGDVLATVSDDPDQIKYSEFMKFMKSVNDGEVKIENGQVISDDFFKSEATSAEDWVKEFEDGKTSEAEANENYNSQFWNRLQNEWKKISEQEDQAHPWLSEFNDYYDPYKEYTFDEENPMLNMENAFEKGKQFLEQGDLPSAVLCFEAAVKQDLSNAEIWQLLGISQAENEKDPNAIAALKRSLDLNPANADVMMALAVSFTNESLQSQALQMLIKWLNVNPKYQHLISPNLLETEGDGAMASSLIRGPELKEVQELFLKAVQQSPDAIDADIQNALGVLFNLSSEYDKAVDCFKAALHVRPDSAKIWNRLGASLANGNRSVEAVDAYQRAIQIQPGFIRARYNVGIICINLKAYKEASEHFLTALNHQASSITRSGLAQGGTSMNQMSDTIWSTFRMAVSLMGRGGEFQKMIDERDINALNEAFAAI